MEDTRLPDSQNSVSLPEPSDLEDLSELSDQGRSKEDDQQEQAVASTSSPRLSPFHRYLKNLHIENLPVTATIKRIPEVGYVIGVAILLLVLIAGTILVAVRSRSSTSGGNHTPARTQRGRAAALTPAPLFSDNFASDGKGWEIGQGKGYSSTVGGNQMILSEANHKVLFSAIPVKTMFTNFSATTTLTLLQGDPGDSAGLYVRGNRTFTQGYMIDVYGNGMFDIYKIFPNSGNDAYLVQPTPSPAINPLGQPNKLTVIMKGAQIIVQINNTQVASVTDTNHAYLHGQIALFAENGMTSDGVKASFNEIIVYPAPA